MKKYAVIVAGGSGLRMGTQVPKQFLLLHGKPVLWYTLNVFLDAYEDLEIILVVPEEHMETGKMILYSTYAPHRIRMTAGGPTRFHSVQHALQLIKEDCVIFVHDGVRCLLSTELVRQCYEKTLRYGSAIPVIESKDSVRLVGPKGSEALERSRVKLVQTPQTFMSNILLPSYGVAYQESFTDDASVVEAFDCKVHLIDGEINNIKITTPMDLIIAQEVLKGSES
jgi:2-C-methyl-D-erythritol 4-phosphate cytidylyltransferase